MCVRNLPSYNVLKLVLHQWHLFLFCSTTVMEFCFIFFLLINRIGGFPFLDILTNIYYLYSFWWWRPFWQVWGDISLWFWCAFPWCRNQHFKIWFNWKFLNFNFILEYGWFIMLCEFQVYSKVIQLCIYPFFFLWLQCTACGIVVPWPGIKPGPSAVKAQNLTHWPPGKSPHIHSFTDSFPK